MVESFKDSMFMHTVRAIKSNPLIYSKIVLAYLILFVLILFVNRFTNLLIPNVTDYILSKLITYNSDILLRVLLLLLYIIFFILLIMVYSLFTLTILGYVRSLTAKYKHDFRLFNKMFSLNIVLTLLFLLLLFFVMPGVLSVISTNAWLTGIIVVMIITIFLLYYIFFNFVQSLFIMGLPFRDNLHHSSRALISKAYYGVLLVTFTILLIYVATYALLGVLFEYYISQHYNTFLNVSTYLSLILLSFLLAFNNVYFYFITKHRVVKKIKKR
jgi:hypothetical protein